jgi:hypothetical protein
MTTATAPHLPESGHRALHLLPSVTSERLKDPAYQA